MVAALEKHAIALQQAQIHGSISLTFDPDSITVPAIHLLYLPGHGRLPLADRLALALGIETVPSIERAGMLHHRWEGTLGRYGASLTYIDDAPITIDVAAAATVAATVAEETR